MLFLINRRYPTLGVVLGVLAAGVFVAIGVTTSDTSTLVFGALSLFLTAAQAIQLRRRSTQAGQR